MAAILKKIQDKFSHLALDVKNRGLMNFLAVKVYDTSIKLRLYLAGINFSQTQAQLNNASVTSLNNDAYENQTSSYYDIKRGFSFLPFTKNEMCLVDIGCGSGRVINYSMLQKIKYAIGVDLEEDAVKLADGNCNVLKQKGNKTPFEVIKADASVYELPEFINTVYLFNPFGKQTMQAVAANIVKHAEKIKKPVFVVYYLPSCKDVFEQNKSFTKTHEEFDNRKVVPQLSIFKAIPSAMQP